MQGGSWGSSFVKLTLLNTVSQPVHSLRLSARVWVETAYGTLASLLADELPQSKALGMVCS